jgi:hypothetical protein
MASKTRRPLVVTAIAAAPAQGRLDHGAGAASPRATPQVEATGFDSNDAVGGIGIDLAVGALTFGGGLAGHRQLGGSSDTSPATVR